MKCASKKVGLSFICERAPAKLQPKMHRRTRWSRFVSFRFEIHIESIYKKNTYVCDYPSQPLREVVARTTAHRRFVRPDYFWSFGRGGAPQSIPSAIRWIFLAAGNDRFRRTDCPSGTYAAGPRRRPRVGSQRGLSGGSRAGAACARPSGCPTHNLSRLHSRRCARCYGRGRGVRLAIVPDGAWALRGLRSLRRAALDAGDVLRNRSSGNRDHRSFRVQTHEANAGERQVALGNIRGAGSLNSVDLPRDHLAFSARWSSEPICQGFSQPFAGQKYGVVVLRARNSSDIRRKQHTVVDLRLLREGRTLCVRKRTRCCALPLRWSCTRASLVDRQTICGRGRSGNDYAGTGGHHGRFYRVSGSRSCRSNSGSTRNILTRLPYCCAAGTLLQTLGEEPAVECFRTGCTRGRHRGHSRRGRGSFSSLGLRSAYHLDLRRKSCRTISLEGS